MGRAGRYGYVLKCKLVVASMRKGGDPLKLAHAIRHLGDAYNHGQQAELAEPCFIEALSIYRKNERTPPLDLANAIRGFAVLKDYAGAINEAKELWQEAHDIYAALDLSAGVAETAARLALLAHRRGDLEASRVWLNEANAAAELSNDPETLQYTRDVMNQIES